MPAKPGKSVHCWNMATLSQITSWFHTFKLVTHKKGILWLVFSSKPTFGPDLCLIGIRKASTILTVPYAYQKIRTRALCIHERRWLFMAKVKQIECLKTAISVLFSLSNVMYVSHNSVKQIICKYIHFWFEIFLPYFRLSWKLLFLIRTSKFAIYVLS